MPTNRGTTFPCLGKLAGRYFLSTPCTNFHATPAPHKPSNGYALDESLGLIIAKASGSTAAYVMVGDNDVDATRVCKRNGLNIGRAQVAGNNKPDTLLGQLSQPLIV